MKADENQDEFLKKMENLNLPDIRKAPGLQPVKLAVLSASRSSALGVWFVAVPCYFLLCVFMKYHFHVHMGIITTMEDMLAGMGKNPYLKYLSPVLMVGLPLINVAINMLALLHVQHNRGTRELVITFKIRWPNIILAAIGLALTGIFVLYAIAENLHH